VTRTRFAPAPTGFLHLGHVASALYVWGFGRRLGAEVLLRIEDHDRQRSRPEYERAILDDLDWLGFVPDLFPTNAFHARPCASRQSDRGAVYARAAAGLVARGMVYACACSRQQIEAARAGGQEAAGGPCPGDCASLGLPLDGDAVSWRLLLPQDSEAFADLLCGPQTQHPDRSVVIRDRLGNWTYQFAVSVDDLEQGIDLVVRGRDILDSTATQMAIGRLLGRERPATYAHHALVMRPTGRKLSKSDGAMGIRELRAAGWPPGRVIDEARDQALT